MRDNLGVPQKVTSSCFKSSTQTTGTASRGSCQHPPASSHTPFPPHCNCTSATGLLYVQWANQVLFRLRTRPSHQPFPFSCWDFFFFFDCARYSLWWQLSNCGTQASLVVACRLSCPSSPAMWHLSSLTRDGTFTPALEGGFVTTGPLGKSLSGLLNYAFWRESTLDPFTRGPPVCFISGSQHWAWHLVYMMSEQPFFLDIE